MLAEVGFLRRALGLNAVIIDTFYQQEVSQRILCLKPLLMQQYSTAMNPLLAIPETIPEMSDRALHYPDIAPPSSGEWSAIAPGFYWLRMPLPFALNHINLWLIRDHYDGREGYTLIDTGIHDATTQQCWEGLIAQRLEGLPIIRVICTHLHPDHIGLAAWLCERFNCPLWMSASEYGLGRLLSLGVPGTDTASLCQHFARHGMQAPARQAELQARGEHFQRYVPTLPTSYIRIEAGQRLVIGGHHWRVLIGRGHSPEHVSLYCEDLALLIAGDMLLPRISTNLSVFALEPEANPIPQFLDSIAHYSELPATTLVLPAHGLPFQGMHTRIEQLKIHHALRLREVLAECATPQSAYSITASMFKRPLDAHQLTFAIGEALAHLHCLWQLGALRREQDQHGQIRFVCQ
nr:MBL fold metallo-hydrolase [Parvibium lacunae]